MASAGPSPGTIPLTFPHITLENKGITTSFFQKITFIVLVVNIKNALHNLTDLLKSATYQQHNRSCVMQQNRKPRQSKSTT